jgi:hypothetical protein
MKSYTNTNTRPSSLPYSLSPAAWGDRKRAPAAASQRLYCARWKSVDGLLDLLVEAHDRKAWMALGYLS